MTANNRIVGRRLPPPHHLGVDDRLPRAADRGDARRARAALARGLRAHAARLPVAARHRDRPPAVAPAPPGQREIRAIERLKSWDGRLDARHVAGTIFHAFTVVFAQRGRARGRRRPRAGRALPEQVRRSRCSRSCPRRGASRSGCWSCGTRATRPGSPRRAAGGQAVGRGRARGAAQAPRRARGALRPRPGTLALGPRARRRVHAPVRGREPAASGGSSTARSRPAARARR